PVTARLKPTPTPRIAAGYAIVGYTIICAPGPKPSANSQRPSIAIAKYSSKLLPGSPTNPKNSNAINCSRKPLNKTKRELKRLAINTPSKPPVNAKAKFRPKVVVIVVKVSVWKKRVKIDGKKNAIVVYWNATEIWITIATMVRGK